MMIPQEKIMEVRIQWVNGDIVKLILGNSNLVCKGMIVKKI